MIEIAVYEWTDKNGLSRTNHKARMKVSFLAKFEDSRKLTYSKAYKIALLPIIALWSAISNESRKSSIARPTSAACLK